MPKTLSRRIAGFAPRLGPFGALPVRAAIGRAHWRTSIFPDRKAGAYLLPIKAEVRKTAGIGAGDRVRIRLELDL